MATQTLEFNATTGLTLTAKLYAQGSDTQVASVSATEATNRKGRYTAAFTDVAAGTYNLIAFVSSTGGFANEVYDLTLTTATFYPRSEQAALTAATTRSALGMAAADLDTQLDAILAASGGDPVTAADIVDEIENRGITTVAVQSGVTSSTTLELVQGDTYDGTGKPLLAFTVTKDYTSGWSATLTIRDEDDAVVASYSGTVASATSITFSATAPTGLTMSGCPGSWKGKFDVQLSKNSSRDTITRGACYVYEDQTRS